MMKSFDKFNFVLKLSKVLIEKTKKLTNQNIIMVLNFRKKYGNDRNYEKNK